MSQFLAKITIHGLQLLLNSDLRGDLQLDHGCYRLISVTGVVNLLWDNKTILNLARGLLFYYI